MKLGNYNLELINVDLGTTALVRAWCGGRSFHIQWAQSLAERMADFVPRRIWEEGIVLSMRSAAEDAIRRRDITST